MKVGDKVVDSHTGNTNGTITMKHMNGTFRVKWEDGTYSDCYPIAIMPYEKVKSYGVMHERG